MVQALVISEHQQPLNAHNDMAKKAANRKPDQEHQALGTYRADRHAQLSPKLKGKPLKRTAKPPAHFHLIPEEVEIWKSIVKLLVTHKLATELDIDAIASYARSLYQWIDYSRDVETNGIYIASERGTKANPAATFMHQAWIRCQTFQKQFGLNHLAREALEDTGWETDKKSAGSPRIYQPAVQSRRRG